MEFDLINRIAAQARTRNDVALGIGDDAALLRVPSNRELVTCCDTLNVGVHFPHDAQASDIGWKALAVNLSDLAAMGATPAWALLSLTLPEPDAAFVDGLVEGFMQLAREADVALVGGDTTRGPLAVSVTALGFVEPGRALRRDGAKLGDAVFVSGMLGDAAAGLRLWCSGVRDPAARVLFARLHHPEPRSALGMRLASVANAAIDISDGLLADLGHIAERSSVGIELDVAAVPTSAALIAHFDEAARRTMQLAGGDDYELAFTVPPARIGELRAIANELQVPLTRIGEVVAGSGVRVRDADGRWLESSISGWDHFGKSST